MKEFLQWLSGVQIQIGIMVFLILGLRIILKKAPRIYSYLLWLLVFVRLLCPINISSPFSVIPNQQMLAEAVSQPEGNPLTGNDIVNEAVPVQDSEDLTDAGQDSLQVEGDRSDAFPNENAVSAPVQIKDGAEDLLSVWLYPLLLGIWITGAGCLLLYNGISLVRLKRRLKWAEIKNGYRISKFIETPFVLGIFSPQIYLPQGMGEKETTYVLEHERTHIMRKDHMIKPVCLILTCIYWFNPFVWTAFLLMDRDMEMSCDEYVIGRMGETIKADYSQSLLQFATGRKPLSVPLAFGENNVKKRVRNVLTFKKKAVWISVVAVVLCITAGAVLLTTRSTQEPDDSQPDIENAEKEDVPGPVAKASGELYDAALQWASRQSLYEGTFGESYEIYLTEEDTVLIYYETWTVEPEITILAEELSYVETGEGILFQRKGFCRYDSIDTLAEFEKVYMPLGEEIPYCFTGPFVEWIFDRLMAGDEAAEVFCKPETAAQKILHLGEGEGEIIYANAEQTIATYRYTFAEDNSVLEIPMHVAEFSAPVWTVGTVSEDYAQSKIIEELDIEGSTYRFYENGFYRVREDGSLQCLYPGYITGQCLPCCFDGNVYFYVYLQHTPYSLDYRNSGMIEVTLDTDTWRVVYDEDGELWDVGGMVTGDIPSHSFTGSSDIGKIYEIEPEITGTNGNMEEIGIRAYWDTNLDGEAEELKLIFSAGDYLLMVNGASAYCYAENPGVS